MPSPVAKRSRSTIQEVHPQGADPLSRRPSRRSRHTKQIQIHHLAAQAERRGKSVTRSGTSWHHAQIQNTSYASTTKLEPIANIKGQEDRAHTAQEHASFARMRNHIAIQNLAGNLQRPKAYHAPLQGGYQANKTKGKKTTMLWSKKTLPGTAVAPTFLFSHYSAHTINHD